MQTRGDDDILKAVASGSRRIDDIAIRMIFRHIRALVDRVGELEREQNRALVVDVLPVNAPLGVLLRLRGDLTGALYLGNGPTRPLTKVLPGVL